MSNLWFEFLHWSLSILFIAPFLYLVWREEKSFKDRCAGKKRPRRPRGCPQHIIDRDKEKFPDTKFLDIL